MAKSGAQIKELQRRLVRLSRLDGRLVVCSDGAWLLWPAYVRSPQPLLQALETGGGLSYTLLAGCLQLQSGLLPLTKRWLASAQRDLRALALDVDALAQTAAAARRFRNLPAPTPAWLAERQQRLDALSAELAAPTLSRASVASGSGGASSQPWFAAVVGFVQLLRGKTAGERLRALWLASGAGEPERAARRRMAAFLLRLEGQPDKRREEPALSAFLDDVARDVRVLLGPPPRPLQPLRLGRAALRRLVRTIRSVISWPAPVDDTHPPELDGAALQTIRDARVLVRTLAEPLLAHLVQRRAPNYHDVLARTLAHYGLLFRIDADCKPITGLDVHWLEQQRDRAATELAPYGLTLTQAIYLLRLPAQQGSLDELGQQVARGVPVELLVRASELGYHKQLRNFSGDAAALRAYCQWVVRLAPLYQQLGRKLVLSPQIASRFAALREPNLSFLLHVLVGSDRASWSSPASIEQELMLLDAAVGLCQRAPQRAAQLGELLIGWPSGAGRARFPAFADWLHDDALLDRYVHLCTLAGEKVELSRTLQRDFTRAERLFREHAFLRSVQAPTKEQAQRLHTVEQTQSVAALPGPGWTRRRLAERNTELQGRALLHQLDAALLDVLRKGLGVAPDTLTAAWRDAIRFYLLTDRNDELLGTLLRFAAAQPGVSPARAFAKNQKWLQRASPHLDIKAWLMPRRAELVLDGQRYVLATEEDPLEVLRMGIPFDTCLSITGGVNAASTVLNAIDANMRVLYLRDERGVIVGRKLLAISSQWELLGYELYLALAAPLKPQVAAAVLALCQQLAKAAGVPLAERGRPERIHDGFWYDDGPQSFVPGEIAEAARLTAEVQAYCLFLGQPVPAPSPANLATEAAQWRAQSATPIERALALLRPWHSGIVSTELGVSVIARLGLPAAERLASEQHDLQPSLFDRLAAEQPERLLTVAATCRDVDAHYVRQALYAVEPSPRLALAMLEAGERTMRRRERPDDHGLAHLTFTDLQNSLALLPIGQLLSLCERLETLWEWFLKTQTGCQPCRDSGVDAVRRAARISYARQPDARSVLTWLRSRRLGSLAQNTALHLAAAFVLTEDPAPISMLWPRRPGDGKGSPAGLRAVQGLGARQPKLARAPELLAALLRQSPRPVRIELPIPDEAPFRALADLLLDAEVRQLLFQQGAPFLRGPQNLHSYRQEPWEGRWALYFHRRVETPLRKRIAQLALGDTSSETGHPEVLCWLMLLGDVATLSALSSRLGSGHRGRQCRDSLEQARHVAAQVELDAGLAEPLSDQLRPSALLHIDQGLLQKALGVIEQTLSTAGPVTPDYCFALKILHKADVSAGLLSEFLGHLAAARRDTLGEDELALASWFLSSKMTYDIPEVSPQLIVDLWQFPALRASLCAALANGSQWPQRHLLLQRHAERCGRSLDGLLAQWLPAHIERDVDTAVSATNTRADLQQLLRAAFASLSPVQWLAIYQALAGYADAACFLDELRHAVVPPEHIDTLRHLSQQAEPYYPDEVARLGWLRAALAAWPAPNST